MLKAKWKMKPMLNFIAWKLRSDEEIGVHIVHFERRQNENQVNWDIKIQVLINNIHTKMKINIIVYGYFLSQNTYMAGEILLNWSEFHWRSGRFDEI